MGFMGGALLAILVTLLGTFTTAARESAWDGKIVMPTEQRENEPAKEGQRWAILVAGSSGYGNYRHQVGFHLSNLKRLFLSGLGIWHKVQSELGIHR